MLKLVSDYLVGLVDSTGHGWNRFWFAPEDPLPLCALRVLTGLIGFYWLASFTPDLTYFFGASGLASSETMQQWRGLLRMNEVQAGFSYLNWLSSPTELWIAHVLACLVMVSFTIGLFTRASSILALIVITSYANGALPATGQLEPILAMITFYLCLGPAGDYLSVDAWRKRKHGPQVSADLRALPSEKSSATIVLRLLQVHLSIVYLMMGLSKLYGEPWWTGTATWWLLARPDSRMFDLTGVLSGHPYFVNAWSHAIVLFELSFGVLIWVRVLRPLLLAFSVIHWSLLAIATGDAPWCFLMIAAGLAFVPSEFLRLFPLPGVKEEAATIAAPVTATARPVSSRV